MKIYTKTGDEGETSLLAGVRVSKDHARIEAYGTLDELNASLGVARAECERAIIDADGAERLTEVLSVLEETQHRLFDLGAELASANPSDKLATVGDHHVDSLEGAIDRFEALLPPLRQFVLPGGSGAAAQLHAARCVCRRAERRIVSLAGIESIRELPIRYVNRLSDLLFVMARVANQASGVGDTAWRKSPE